jgi:hypothetical protein
MSSVTLEHVIVSTDADLITLRQLLRRSARQCGLSATQQARITAAISEILRALVGQVSSGDVTIRFDDEPGQRPALAVICATPLETYAQISAQPLVREACALADELQLVESAPNQHLLMRMWAAQ